MEVEVVNSVDILVDNMDILIQKLDMILLFLERFSKYVDVGVSVIITFMICAFSYYILSRFIRSY